MSSERTTLYYLLASALLVCLPWCSGTSGSHLDNYDQRASSSSFGEPVFRLQPPSVINFSSLRGTTLLCLASGLPRPTIRWYATSLEAGAFNQQSSLAPPNALLFQESEQQTRQVNSVPNLRLISQNGAALRLLPFKESQFRQEIHAAEYRCVASNYLATIHSRGAQVQAVLPAGEPLAEAKVAPEFAQVGAPAVLRCRPRFELTNGEPLAGFQLAHWLANEPNIQIGAGQTSKGNKFTAFKSGELHVQSVEQADFKRAFGCLLRHPVTRQTLSSPRHAQLIATEAAAAELEQSRAAFPSSARLEDEWQVLHTVSSLVALDASALLRRRSAHLDNSDTPLGGHAHALFNPQPAGSFRAARPPSGFVEEERGENDDDADDADESEWRLLLPCALRPPPGRATPPSNLGPLGWFYQAPAALPSGEREPPVPLEHWLKQLAVPFVQLTGGLGGASAHSGARRDSPLNKTATPTSRFLQGATFLAIEWPRKAHSGRYLFGRQAAGAEASAPPVRTVCDINVIVREPIALRVEADLGGRQFEDSQSSARNAPAEADDEQWAPPSSLLARAVSWLGGRRRIQPSRVSRRATPPSGSASLLDEEPSRLRVRPLENSAGLVEAPPIVRVGARLQLECAALAGHPIETVKWFKNGQPINTQSPNDFQVEIFARHAAPLSAGPRPLSTLLIRQVQARDVGLQMFECFAWSSLGDRARAGLALFVAGDSMLDRARSACPLRAAGGRGSSAEPRNSSLAVEFVPEPEADEAGAEEAAWSPAEQEAGEFFSGADNGALALLWRHNPFKRALVLESEPVELVCPLGAANVSQWGLARPLEETNNKQVAGAARNFNQLFGAADPRFVINGSSLQIRSPSKRHDEAIYGCRAGQQRAADAGGLHQSSLACGALLGAALFPAAASAPQAPMMSSISIRIVAKPKIDPFEFSRNLEDSMRTVVVCAVLQGQAPIDITWFKDGQLLTANELMSLHQTNDFSSTLTFHKIQPAHSGLYTCVASNAFASTSHSSRLTVNVAPYFIDPPRSARALLNTDVLVNCRAGGQPSPQIRWRKLVAPSAKAQAPSGGAGAKLPAQTSEPFEFVSDALQQAAPAAQRPEYRVIASNSHIQILENGSMIIKELEPQDASRYVCQAFNGINPSLSEMIELTVLSPAAFELNYETVSVKRDSMVKFNCAPKGDQPMSIEWRKEAHLLAPLEAGGQQQQQPQQHSKYSQVAHYANNSEKHTSLQLQAAARSLQDNASRPLEEAAGMSSSELFISYADRADSGAFVCLARNQHGADQLTYRLVVQEPPDAPASVSALSVQANSLKLSWLAPFDGNLALSYFVIEYKRAAGGPLGSAPAAAHGEWTRLVVSTGNKLLQAAELQQQQQPAPTNGGQQQQQPQALAYSFALRQLSAKTTYHIRLAAANALGQGAYSAPLTVTSAEEPPSQRANDLRLQPVSSSALRVLWRGPPLVEEHAPIKGYYVSHRKLAPAGSAAEPGDWLATSSVSAANSTPSYLGGQLEARLQAAPPGGANYEFLVEGLEKNTKYELRLQPFNSVGLGPPSEAAGATLKFDRPAQPALKLVAARRQSLELKWAVGAEQPLLGFSLFYKLELDDWQEIQLGVVFHYLIENLRCGNKYQLYLSAFNAVGRSDPSDVLSARTEGSAPLAPDKSQFVEANQSEALLDLSAWQSGGCPITSFMVHFKRLHEPNWFVLAENATPFANSDKITVRELAPATWYKLLVTALNEAGTTNAEYLFSTLTLRGEPLPPPAEPGPGWLMGGVAGPNQRNSLWSGLGQFLFGSSANGKLAASQQSQLLLPTSCLLLLLAAALAAYLYQGRPNRAGAANNNGGGGGGGGLDGYHQHHHQQQQQQQQRALGRSSSLAALKCQAGAHFDTGSLARNLIVEQAGHAHSGSEQAKLLQAAGYPAAGRSVLDSLVGAFGGALHEDPRCVGQQQHQHQQQQQQHSMRLLAAPANSNCTSSSISTHSTSCFEPTCGSSSSSANTATSGGARAKLQLIDESSLMFAEPALAPAPLDEQQRGQLYAYAAAQLDHQQADSPLRRAPALQDAGHLDLLAAAPYNLSAGHFQQGGVAAGGRVYANAAAQARLLGSGSFASAAELANQQQQQQQQLCQQPTNEEPVYQRLDKFQASYAGRAAFHAHTLRLGAGGGQHAHFALTELAGEHKAATLERAEQLGAQLQAANGALAHSQHFDCYQDQAALFGGECAGQQQQ